MIKHLVRIRIKTHRVFLDAKIVKHAQVVRLNLLGPQ